MSMLNFLIKNCISRFFLKKVWRIFSLLFPALALKIKSAIFKRKSPSISIDNASKREIRKLNRLLENYTRHTPIPKIVLMLSTYPFKIPRHGGQIRCHAITEQYRKAGYFVVCFIVRGENSYINESIAIDEVIFPSTSPYRFYQESHVPFLEDYFTALFSENDPQVIDALERRIKHALILYMWNNLGCLGLDLNLKKFFHK